MVDAVGKPRRAMREDMFDRALVVGAFVIGAGGLILLKFATNLVLAPILLAALVLCGYAILASMNPQSRLEPETIGDNCYYLGFLFTLTSLGVTLYAMSGPEIGLDLQRDIVAGFGVALSSTVMGMFLRLLLMQIRADIVARDREARRELLAATREFRGALAGSIAEVKAFSTESVQLAAETSARMAKSAEALLEQQKDSAEANAAAYRAALHDGLQAAGRAVAEDLRSSLRDPLAETARQLEASLKELACLLDQQAQQQREANAIRAEEEAAARADRKAVEAGGIELVAAMQQGQREMLSVIREFRDALSDTVTDAKAVSTKSVEFSTELSQRLSQASEDFLEHQKNAAQANSAAYRDALTGSLRTTATAVAEDLRRALRDPMAETARQLEDSLKDLTSILAHQAGQQREAMALRQAEDQASHAVRQSMQVGAGEMVTALQSVTGHVIRLGRTLESALTQLEPVEDTKGPQGDVSLKRSLEIFDRRLARVGDALEATATTVDAYRSGLEHRMVQAEAERGRRRRRWWRLGGN